jgi:hypothetical protein
MKKLIIVALAAVVASLFAGFFLGIIYSDSLKKKGYDDELTTIILDRASGRLILRTYFGNGEGPCHDDNLGKFPHEHSPQVLETPWHFRYIYLPDDLSADLSKLYFKAVYEVEVRKYTNNPYDWALPASMKK